MIKIKPMKTKIAFTVLTTCFLIHGIVFSQDKNIKQIKDKYVIVLDIQKHFTEDVIPDKEAEQLIKTINAIVDKANPEKVIYVKSILTTLNISLKGFDVDTLPKLEFDNRLNIVNDQIVVKNKANAFKSKELTKILEKNNAKKVIVVGLMAGHCVYKTLLGGMKLGYKMYAIPEAIAGKSAKSKKRILRKLENKNVEFIESKNIVSPELKTKQVIVFYSGSSGNNDIYIMDVNGSNRINLTKNPASDLCPAISPDGSKIAFLSDRNGNQDIYLMNVDGTQVEQLTNSTEPKEHISWSVNGNNIYFIKDFQNRTEIWKMNSDGSEHHQLTNNSFRDERPFLSPDGKTVLFMSNRDGNYNIYLMNPDGSNQRRITNTPEHEIFPTWSPDGTGIAYGLTVMSGSSPEAEIHLINPDGTGDIVLTDVPGRDENPCFSQDGKSIIFQSERDGNFEIYVMNIKGTNQKRITNNPAWDGWASFGKITE